MPSPRLGSSFASVLFVGFFVASVNAQQVAQPPREITETCIRHSPDKDIRRAPRLADGLSTVLTAVECIELCESRRPADNDQPANCQAAVHVQYQNLSRSCQLYARDTGSQDEVFRTAFSVSTEQLLQRLGEMYNLYEWIEDCFPEPQWAQWQEWSECDQPCATPDSVGQRVRQRDCNPVVRDGLTIQCPGLGLDQENCNESPCEAWGAWMAWGECSASCGTGAQVRERNCVFGESSIGQDEDDPDFAVTHTFFEELERCNELEGEWAEEQECVQEDCPAFGEWGEWSACDSTCGVGLRRRERLCLSLLFPCDGDTTEEETCTEAPCNEWGAWASWLQCSETCGPGVRRRLRSCENEATAPCLGSGEELELCNDGDCPSFTKWSAWGKCSVSCGGGARVRTRDCVLEGDVIPGEICPFASTSELAREEPCNLRPCPQWRQWTQWGQCSASCGTGVQERLRECGAGDSCGDGSAREERSCDGGACPTWAAWEAWAQCSKTCGIGFRTRSRSCENGIACDGTRTATEACDEGGCPAWSHWQPWQPCDKTCGGGSRQRLRRCAVLNTVEDDALCAGQSSERGACNALPCEEWGSWGSWGGCAVSCGIGSVTRTRTCEGGLSCLGARRESKECDAGPCAYWAGWSNWAQCSVSCGRGSKTRERNCEGGAPGDCPGQESNSVQCNAGPCSEWSQWEQWGGCSTSCGEGIKQRHRQCSGYSCPGKKMEVTSCYQDSCPMPAHWTDWEGWSECSSSCGQGDFRERKRSCIGGSGRDCSGDYREYRECPSQSCAAWSTWGAWGLCDTKCGTGQRTRSRDCQGGSACAGERTDSESCEADCWPTWSSWGRWTSCVGRCGKGIRLRRRKCLGGRGADCPGKYHEREDCSPKRACEDRSSPAASYGSSSHGSAHRRSPTRPLNKSVRRRIIKAKYFKTPNTIPIPAPPGHSEYKPRFGKVAKT